MEPRSRHEKSLDQAQEEPGVENKTELGLPAQMELYHRGSDLEIVRKWFSWFTVLLTAFTAIWAWVAFSQLGAMIKGRNPLSLVFPVAGVFLAYLTVAQWLNRTRIVVSRDKITVRHGPVPWGGNKQIEASNLMQVYTKEVRHGGKGGGTRTYELHALTRDGRSVKLVSGLAGLDSAQALFIEKEIEKYLGIKDVPVEGEFSPALRKDAAIQAGVAAAPSPSLEKSVAAHDFGEALLAPTRVQQEKRQESWHEQDLIDLALNWQARGRPDSLRHADLIEADLRGARLGKDEEGHPGANLSFANLLNAKLGGADLREVDLYNANLSGATLEGANLEGANLYEVNFSGADLEGATLVGAKIIPEQLAQARSLKGAIMPDGTVHP